MNIRRRLSSGDLLLLELVFAIIFFCLAMAASMSVFGNAYEMSSKAAATNEAVREAVSAAEMIRASSSVEEAGEFLKMNGFTPSSDSRFEKKYGDEDSTISVSLTTSGRLMTGTIECFDKDGNSLYSLTVDHDQRRTEDG